MGGLVPGQGPDSLHPWDAKNLTGQGFEQPDQTSNLALVWAGEPQEVSLKLNYSKLQISCTTCFLKPEHFYQKLLFWTLMSYIIHTLMSYIIIALKSSTGEVGINFLQRKDNYKVRKDFLLTQNIRNWLQDYDKIIKIFINKSQLKARTT